jgi:hypothetical protein
MFISQKIRDREFLSSIKDIPCPNINLLNKNIFPITVCQGLIPYKIPILTTQKFISLRYALQMIAAERLF